ncbi:MAG: sigma 54-interacting transcriptional regulator, partial [Prochlorococcaceae cyanobacterium]
MADSGRSSDEACLLKLAPHLLGRTRRGVVGSSRYAERLREAVRRAAADPQAGAVLISGEPGLGKDNLAALIHFGSARRRRLMARIDAAALGDDGAALFGSASSGGDGSLLDCLGDGALLIDNLDRADPRLRPQLLELLRSGRWRAAGAGGPERLFSGRLFCTTESALPEFDGCAIVIRVPPLRVRRQDLGEWLRYGIRQQARGLGWSRPPQVSEAVVKRLQSHDFPGNLRELEGLVERALRQSADQASPAAATLPATLPDEVFWTGSRGVRPRFDLWRWKPRLRFVMREPRLWNVLLFGLVSWVFVLVNLWLWLGPQDQGHNGGLNLFWAWWWPLILLGFPLVGRLWCSFCPFMVWGEISQR